MKTAFRYLLACGCFALVAVIAVAQTDFSGHWEGAVDVPNGPTRLALDLAKNAKGVWVASLGVPEQKVTGLRVTDVSVVGSEVRFAAPDLPGSPTFELTLADGKLKGAVLVQALSLALEMQRTGDAKLDIAQPSPAVSKELEGDWEGSISLPNGQSRAVAIHFKNQPDQTVEATIESPSQGVRGFPLKDVAQKGAVVEFAVQAVGGSYKGTLNKEGTEMAGEWTQRSGSAPLTLNLKKK
jgi:hypothetical protein